MSNEADSMPDYSYLNNFIETIHRSHCGGTGVWRWQRFADSGDGDDDAKYGDGISTSRASWSCCCADFGVGAGGGGVCGDRGRH